MNAAPALSVNRDAITVLLVDDQRLVREGLRTLLELQGDISVVGEAGDGLKAEHLVELLRPRIVLMDLQMPRHNGVAATRRITSRWPGVRVIMLTTCDDEDLVFRSIEAGAAGYLLKDVGSDALAEAIRAAGRGESPLQPSIARMVLRRLRECSQHEGGPPESMHARPPSLGLHPSAVAHGLTARELDVLRLLGTGATNREIADRLALTIGTVKNYISAILAKTGLHDRTQAALFAVRNGLAVT